MNQNVFGQGWEWAKNAYGIGNVRTNCVTTDSVGNVYITGTFNSPTITFGTTILTNIGGQNVFLVKYDSLGNVLWAKSSIGGYNARPSAIKTDRTGSVYVIGYFDSSSIVFGSHILTQSISTWLFSSYPYSSPPNFFLVKFDPEGNVLWTKNAGYATEGIQVVTDLSNNVYIGGGFSSTTIVLDSISLSNSNMSGGIFLAKYNSEGDIIWVQSGNSNYNSVSALAIDLSGNIYMAGFCTGGDLIFGSDTTVDTSFYNVIFLVKFDSMGHSHWVKCGNANSSSGNSVTSLTCDLSGDVYMSGGFQSSEIIFGTDTLASTTGLNAFLVKYNQFGELIWAKCPSGAKNIVNSIVTDSLNNFYVTGWFDSSIVFSSVDTVTSEGFENLFLAKYDSNCNIIWVKSTGGNYDAYGFSCNMDLHGSIYISGYYSSPTISFEPTILSDSSGTLYSCGFVAKFSESTLSLQNLNKLQDVKVYPNPTSTILTISTTTPNLQITISNILGQAVYSNCFAQQKVQIDVSGLPNGIYFLTINGKEVRKFIKQ